MTVAPRSGHLSTVVFDLGGVVLSWAPQLPYEQVLPAGEVPAFLAAIDFPSWNRALDAGQTFEAAERSLIARFPESAAAVRAYREHFLRSLTGPVPGTGAVIAELQQAGVRLLALTNWSAESFPHARGHFRLLDRFEAIVVSGEERLMKPDRAIFELFFRRTGLVPEDCVFIDDLPENIQGARAAGLRGLVFRDTPTLLMDLRAEGVVLT